MIISYITSHFGDLKALKRCIESVRLDMLCARIDDYEHLVYLDGDMSGFEIFKLSDLGHVKFLFSEKNQGKSFCVNKLVGLAQGEFLFFLDSDDLNIIGRTEKQLAFLLNNENIILGSNFLNWNGTTTFCLSSYPENNEQIKLEFWKFPYLLYSSMCVRKADLLMNSLFFDETLIGGIDYEFYSRAFQVLKVKNISDSLVVYKSGTPGGITASSKTREAQLNVHKTVMAKLFSLSLVNDSDIINLLFSFVLGRQSLDADTRSLVLKKCFCDKINSGHIGEYYFPNDVDRELLKMYFSHVFGL